MMARKMVKAKVQDAQLSSIDSSDSLGRLYGGNVLSSSEGGADVNAGGDMSVGSESICESRGTAEIFPLLELDGSAVDVEVHKVDRRKIQRRQANRRSAQLSRARKKAQLEALQHENERLMRVARILEAHPDIIFSTNRNGDVLYISDRTQAYVTIEAPEREQPTNVCQILEPSSIPVFFETLQTLSQQYIDSNGNAELEAMNSVFETTCIVKFVDKYGTIQLAQMRCTRIVNCGTEADSAVVEVPPRVPPAKKARQAFEPSIPSIPSSSSGSKTKSAPSSSNDMAMSMGQLLGTSSVDMSGSTIGSTISVLSRITDRDQADISSYSDNSRDKDQEADALNAKLAEKLEFVCNLRPLSPSEGFIPMKFTNMNMIQHNNRACVAEELRGGIDTEDTSSNDSHNSSHGSKETGNISKLTSSEDGSEPTNTS